jgi:pyocin large subunit-like protein
MDKVRRTFSVTGVLIALLATFVFAGTHFSKTAPSTAPASGAATVGWTAPTWTGGERNAREHWEKHGLEFPEFSDMQAYVNGVHAFLLKPPPGTLVKHRENGDTLYFNPGSGIFAVQASNGAPRTFFRPDDGVAYWERQ